MKVLITLTAQKQFDDLPLGIQARVRAIFERLTRWPDVSGEKELRNELRGGRRLRTGSYRVVYTVNVQAQTVVVFRIDDRKDVYR